MKTPLPPISGIRIADLGRAPRGRGRAPGIADAVKQTTMLGGGAEEKKATTTEGGGGGETTTTTAAIGNSDGNRATTAEATEEAPRGPAARAGGPRSTPPRT